MDPLVIGGIVALVTVVVLFSGVSVAIGLLLVATLFLWIFDGPRSLTALPELFYAELNSFALLSIPMFIIMGASIASTRAGPDLYEALERWLTRVPGGLLVSNLGACALFAAMSGSSPATCAAIGKMGIPEMRRRGYPAEVAAGSIAAGGTLGILIPPSVTMIVYGIATETSIGRLFLAGVIPGLLLTLLFIAWAIFDTWRRGAASSRRDQPLCSTLDAAPRPRRVTGPRGTAGMTAVSSCRATELSQLKGLPERWWKSRATSRPVTTTTTATRFRQGGAKPAQPRAAARTMAGARVSRKRSSAGRTMSSRKRP